MDPDPKDRFISAENVLFKLVCTAEQAELSLTWRHITKTGFLTKRQAHIFSLFVCTFFVRKGRSSAMYL